MLMPVSNVITPQTDELSTVTLLCMHVGMVVNITRIMVPIKKRAGVIPSLVPRPSYHGVPVRGPGNSGLRMRLIKTARYA